MTLVEIVNKLKKYAEGQFNNPTVMVGSVYENMNTKELRYPCINFDNVNVIKRENDVVYSFYVYYADRLNEDASNQLEIQSQAMNSLQLILHNIYDSGAITLDEFYNAIITPFKLKFVDVCAGAWMQINVHATNGLDYCEGPSSVRTLYITTNGNYNCEDYERVEVTVSGGSGSNIVEVTKEEYDAMVSAGTIDENTLYIISGYTDNYELGYASGWTDGYNESSEGAYQSGYTSGYTDGYQSGFTSGHTSGFTEGYTSGHTDGVESGYTSGYSHGYEVGYEEGEESVPLSSTSITENGTYTKSEGGWNEIIVEVPTGITPTGVSEFTDNGTYDVTNDATAIVNIDKQALVDSGYTSGYTDGYSEGYEDGEESVPLSSTSITENGTYENSEGGWSSVTVDVQTGITPSGTVEFTDNGTYDVITAATAIVNINKQALIDSGYTSGYTDGFQSGFTSGHTSGFTDGYQSGRTDGFNDGYTSGHTDGYNEGFQSGFTSGHTSGFTEGYQSGHTDGVASGYSSGYTFGYGEGFDSGFTSGHTSGFTEGYQSGRTDGVESGFTSGWTSGYTSGYTSGHTDGYAEGQASVPLSSTTFTANNTYTKAEGGWNSVTVNVPSVTTQTLTQAQYDALQVKDPMVIYLING